jgi:hypothetical protein
MFGPILPKVQIKKLAKCCKCKKEYRTSGNTSNLKDHLDRMHPKKQSTIVELDDEDTQSSNSISTYIKKTKCL